MPDQKPQDAEKIEVEVRRKVEGDFCRAILKHATSTDQIAAMMGTYIEQRGIKDSPPPVAEREVKPTPAKAGEAAPSDATEELAKVLHARANGGPGRGNGWRHWIEDARAALAWFEKNNREAQEASADWFEAHKRASIAEKRLAKAVEGMKLAEDGKKDEFSMRRILEETLKEIEGDRPAEKPVVSTAAVKAGSPSVSASSSAGKVTVMVPVDEKDREIAALKHSVADWHSVADARSAEINRLISQNDELTRGTEALIKELDKARGGKCLGYVCFNLLTDRASKLFRDAESADFHRKSYEYPGQWTVAALMTEAAK